MTQAMGRGLEDTKFLPLMVNSKGNRRAQMLMIPYDATLLMTPTPD